VDELGPAEFKSNERFESPVTVKVSLPASMYLYDLRQCKFLGEQRSLTVTVNPYEPTMIAAVPGRFAAPMISAPSAATRGSLVQLGFDLPGSPAALHAVHVDVIDPEGHKALNLSGNILAEDGHGVKLIPLAFNDPTGKWTLKVHDLLSGNQQTLTMMVN
jgi:hypothetical protein